MTLTATRAVVVAVATLVVAVVVLVGPFESIGAADVDRIRHARWVLQTSCRPDVTAEKMDEAARVLEAYLTRAPDRPLPLAGGGGIWSATAVVTDVARFLSHPTVPAGTLGGEAATPQSPCRTHGAAIAGRLRSALAAHQAGADASASASR